MAPNHNSQYSDQKKTKIRKLEQQAKEKVKERKKSGSTSGLNRAMADLHQAIGNQAIQRIMAQRQESDAPMELEEEIADRIDRQRGSGSELDGEAREGLEASLGQNFNDVRVHTSPEADGLNRQLGARAFTTGQDIFFRNGAYSPQSSSGRELIAHELTHVVQQMSGRAGGTGGKMMVNAPGDAYEQEADRVAQQVTSPSGGEVQKQEIPEEEVQMQEMPEEEELAQMQEMPEEEELAQMQEEDEEELTEMQEEDEEEIAQTKR